MSTEKQWQWVTEEVYSESGGTEWSLPDFLADIQDAVSKIPEECRSTTKVNLEGGYDESTYLRITYSRLQTDKEFAEAQRWHAHYEATAQMRDREEFERLKAKFGNT